MRMKKIAMIMMTALALNSCIKNDIPLPYIEGDIVEMTVEGQKSSTVDPVKNTIQIEISDSVDIRKIQITNLKLTAEARLTDSITTQQIDSGSIYDFSNARVPWIVTTYQEYPWTIIPVQPINRHIEAENQIGLATIDINNKTAEVAVTQGTDLSNIVIKSLQLANSIAITTPEPLSITDFTKPVEFTVSYFDIVEKWNVSFVEKTIQAQTDKATAWAKFATLMGTVLPNSPEIAGFQYRVTGAEQWNTLEATPVGSQVEAIATKLTPNREYEYRTFLGQDYGETLKFTTLTTPAIPNLNFNDGYLEGITFYPNGTGKNSYWGTGNEGLTSKLAGSKPSNTVNTVDAVKGMAMQLTSVGGITVVGHAAGNLFTGTFEMGSLSLNPEILKSYVKFGRQYTGKPMGLKGHFKYISTPITLHKYKPEMAGKPDECHIYIKLENWGDPTLGPGQRPANATVLAYGEFFTSNNISTYTEFNFPLVYDKNLLDEEPTHITLVATSSRYGDDFCGGVGSELKVDEFEILYDYNPLSFK